MVQPLALRSILDVAGGCVGQRWFRTAVAGRCASRDCAAKPRSRQAIAQVGLGGDTGDQRAVTAAVAFEDQGLVVGFASDAVGLFAKLVAVEV